MYCLKMANRTYFLEGYAFLVGSTFLGIFFICLSIFAYQQSVSCELNSIDISYIIKNDTLECIPIEFDSSLVWCNQQTQGYCYDGSNLCFMRPFYETIIKYSLKSSSTNDIPEGIITLKGLDGFPNASIIDLNHFNCFTQIDKSPPNTNRLHEGHASFSDFFGFLIPAIIWLIPLFAFLFFLIRNCIIERRRSFQSAEETLL